MVKAKIMLDGKHVCSAHLKDRVLNVSVASVDQASCVASVCEVCAFAEGASSRK